MVHSDEEPVHVPSTGRTAPVRAQPGRLYVVATPLGNLRDVTLRALDILASVDRIAAEDTRLTVRLLERYGLRARLLAVHEHNERAGAQAIVERLGAGESVALVTDAGTPGISDPGGKVVAAVREAGFPVEPVPGPSAVTAALSVSGFGHTPFLFLGFLPPRTAARRAALVAVRQVSALLVLFEAPHRVRETLHDLAEVLGAARRVVLARELTKRFETIHACALGEAQAWLDAQARRERGEFVLVVEGASPASSEASPGATVGVEADALLRHLLAELPTAQAARIAAAITGLPRRELYERAVTLKA